jgi:hypothetical protein
VTFILVREMPGHDSQRRILSLKKPIQPKVAILEFRLVWNNDSGEWDIYRNRIKTGIARRKKRSAIDTAILAIRAAADDSTEKALILSVKDNVLTTEWESSLMAEIL